MRQYVNKLADNRMEVIWQVLFHLNFLKKKTSKRLHMDKFETKRQ